MIQELDVNETFGNLTIDMIRVESEISNTRLPPFSSGQFLNNWIVVELLVVFKFSNE